MNDNGYVREQFHGQPFEEPYEQEYEQQDEQPFEQPDEQVWEQQPDHRERRRYGIEREDPQRLNRRRRSRSNNSAWSIEERLAQKEKELDEALNQLYRMNRSKRSRSRDRQRDTRRDDLDRDRRREERDRERRREERERERRREERERERREERERDRRREERDRDTRREWGRNRARERSLSPNRKRNRLTDSPNREALRPEVRHPSPPQDRGYSPSLEEERYKRYKQLNNTEHRARSPLSRRRENDRFSSQPYEDSAGDLESLQNERERGREIGYSPERRESYRGGDLRGRIRNRTRERRPQLDRSRHSPQRR